MTKEEIKNRIEELSDSIAMEVGGSTQDMINELISLIRLSDNEPNEDYDMLVRENKAMAEALKKLGYTDNQISDIANGAL